MYKKYLTILAMCNLIILAAAFNIKGIELNRVMAMPAFQASLENERYLGQGLKFIGVTIKAASGQRVVDYGVLEREVLYDLSDEDYEALLRIVEAEAGGEDETGKLLVANVVLNRLNNPGFPDTVKEVIMQKENGTIQFSPVANGRFYQVKISDETKSAVERALLGEDVSQGALYFAARKYADPDKMKWFDRNLTFLFEYGGHEFFS